MTVLRIAFAGTPPFAVPALEAIAASTHRLVGVLTRPDRPAGRGRLLTESAVKRAARPLGLPLLQASTLKDSATRAAIAAWEPEVLVVVAYGLILPPEMLALPRLGCVNVHASLLPRWRGAAPIQRAILAGDAETGVTIMQMDAGLDTGAILLARCLPIAAEATTGALQVTLATAGAALLVEALDRLAAGTLRPSAQPRQGATYALKITKSEAVIDWQSSALDIDRQIRAMNPTPIAETRMQDEPLRVLSARPHHGLKPAGRSAPGTVLAMVQDELHVACGEGVLGLLELQRPGRRPVSARDFANAVPIAGLRLG